MPGWREGAAGTQEVTGGGHVDSDGEGDDQDISFQETAAKGVAMRRSVWFCALLIVVAVGFVSPQPHRLPAAAAQEATPCPLWPQQGPNIVSWEVGQFMQWPSTILVQFAPGASREGDDGTTGAPLVTLVYVQSGAFTLESEAPMAIHRAATNGAPEIMPAGAEFTVEAGDYYVTGPVTPAMRNDGKEAASFQSAVIDPLKPLVIDRCAPLG